MRSRLRAEIVCALRRGMGVAATREVVVMTRGRSVVSCILTAFPCLSCGKVEKLKGASEMGCARM